MNGSIETRPGGESAEECSSPRNLEVAPHHLGCAGLLTMMPGAGVTYRSCQATETHLFALLNRPEFVRILLDFAPRLCHPVDHFPSVQSSGSSPCRLAIPRT